MTSEPGKFLEEPAFYYHEDDFLQVEIVPDNNLSKLSSENNEVDKFAKDHFAGAGFTDIYVRNDEDKIKLKQRRINTTALENILVELEFDRISQVFTGYSEYRQAHVNCTAFCKDESAILYDYEDDIVQHIWLINHWSIHKERLSCCLNHFGDEWQLLLQDWNLTETINLQSREAINKYLEPNDEA